MDLARYCVNAVLAEGRSVRAVAAATGRSKSWVQRHVALYRNGGDEALAPLKRALPGSLWVAQVTLSSDRDRVRRGGSRSPS